MIKIVDNNSSRLMGLFYLVFLLLTLGSCASSQNKNQFTIDLSTISDPVPVGVISLGLGQTYFSSEQASIEGFSEFFSNQIDNILNQFTDMTSVSLDIGTFPNSIENYSGITVEDRAGRLIRWRTEIPADEVWARISVIFAERDVRIGIYVFKPGHDLVYGVYTEPSSIFWFGPETKVSPR